LKVSEASAFLDIEPYSDDFLIHFFAQKIWF